MNFIIITLLICMILILSIIYFSKDKCCNKATKEGKGGDTGSKGTNTGGKGDNTGSKGLSIPCISDDINTDTYECPKSYWSDNSQILDFENKIVYSFPNNSIMQNIVGGLTGCLIQWLSKNNVSYTDAIDMISTNGKQDIVKINKMFYNYYKDYEKNCCNSVDNCKFPYQLSASLQSLVCPDNSVARKGIKFLPSDLFDLSKQQNIFRQLCLN